jgi:restriction system protein
LSTQAKRYGPTSSVSAGEVRDFYGALSIRRATKGLFFTTSTFSRAAEETARSLDSRIVLIDGALLTTLLIRYGIGCRLKDTLRIQEVDETYFEEG